MPPFRHEKHFASAGFKRMRAAKSGTCVITRTACVAGRVCAISGGIEPDDRNILAWCDVKTWNELQLRELFKRLGHADLESGLNAITSAKSVAATHE